MPLRNCAETKSGTHNSVTETRCETYKIWWIKKLFFLQKFLKNVFFNNEITLTEKVEQNLNNEITNFEKKISSILIFINNYLSPSHFIEHMEWIHT